MKRSYSNNQWEIQYYLCTVTMYGMLVTCCALIPHIFSLLQTSSLNVTHFKFNFFIRSSNIKIPIKLHFIQPYCIRKCFKAEKFRRFRRWPFIYKTFPPKLSTYVQDVLFVAKGFTTKLFLWILLNSVIYKTFSNWNFLCIRYTKMG